jgi:hypothetical protein
MPFLPVSGQLIDFNFYKTFWSLQVSVEARWQSVALDFKTGLVFSWMHHNSYAPPVSMPLFSSTGRSSCLCPTSMPGPHLWFYVHSDWKLLCHFHYSHACIYCWMGKEYFCNPTVLMHPARFQAFITSLTVHPCSLFPISFFSCG